VPHIRVLKIDLAATDKHKWEFKGPPFASGSIPVASTGSPRAIGTARRPCA
jgi:hypothetical protein